MASTTTTLSAPVLVELGWLTARSSTGDIRGQLLFLANDSVIVMPQRFHGRRWECLIVAGPPNPRTGRRATFSAATIANARTSIVVDPATAPSTFGLVWQARVWQRWRDGVLPDLGRLLVQYTQPPEHRRVNLDPPMVHRLAQHTRLPPFALQRALGRLTEAGLLTPTGVAWTHHRLTLPELAEPTEPPS